MNVMDKIYESDKFKGLNPLSDKNKILELADLSWEYKVKPLIYFDDNEVLVQSNHRVILLDRNDGEPATEVSVQGQDYKCTNPRDLYQVFLDLRNDLGLELHALGHTRNGKFVYIICKIDANITSTAKSFGFNHFLMIFAANDGNGKTKFAPILIKEDEIEFQLSVIAENQNLGRSKGDYVSTCYELSHHYRFDSTEAKVEVKASISGHFEEFERSLALLASLEISGWHVQEYHHALYVRFNIGNEKTKRGYDRVIAELYENYNRYESENAEAAGSLLGLYLSFVSYIDISKQRKMGLGGRINSINFTHDNVTKRFAYKELLKIASDMTSMSDAASE